MTAAEVELHPGWEQPHSQEAWAEVELQRSVEGSYLCAEQSKADDHRRHAERMRGY